MKKIKALSLILALILVLSMLPISVMATETGEQTESTEQTADPMAITTADQFLALDGKSGTYYLAGDIDFSQNGDWADSTSYTFDDNGYLVTENLVPSFSGVLDGKGHTLYNFTLKYNAAETEDVNVGVFGTLGGTGSVVSNLNIGTADAKIAAALSADDGVTAGALNFGFLAGKVEANTLVAEVNVYGELTSTVAAGTLAIGGIVGNGVEPDFSETTFNGSITAASGTVGGIAGVLGDAEDITVNSLLTKCVNNATITVTAEGAVVAGIVGTTSSTVQLMECTSASAGILGKSNATATTALTLIYNCTTASETDVYGAEVVTGQRVCIMGCSAQNLPIYNADDADNYTNGVYSYVMPITCEADFAKIGKPENPEYSVTGFYRIVDEDNDGKIIFADEAYTGYVVSTFSGVLDGAGNIIDNVTISYGNTHTAFFESFAVSGDATILNLQLGTAVKPAAVSTGGNRYAAALISGSASTSYNTTVYGIDVHVSLKSVSPGQAQRIGGMIGYGNAAKIVESNMYGTIAPASSENAVTVGGFIGASYNAASQYLMLDSNNYINMDVVSKAAVNAKWVNIAGFISGDKTDAYSAVLHNCANFGNIQHSWPGDKADPDTAYPVRVSAFAGLAGKSLILSNCTNFGTISGKLSGKGEAATVGSAVGATQSSTATLSIVNFEDYGTVATDIAGANRYVHTVASDTTVSLCNVDSNDEQIVTMDNGAAIRIDAVRGIRFTSTVSTDALAALEDIFGEGTVSYGTIITPTKFIAGETYSVGDFTIDALESIDLSLGNDKAYVQVDATNNWFKGEEGRIAGSIVGINNKLVDTAFSARAYVQVTVDGTPVCTFYSDYNATNNSRSIAQVADLASKDVLYKTETAAKIYDKDGNFVDATEAQIAEYATNLNTQATVGEITYDTYSCYIDAQLNYIKAILDASAEY